MIRNSSIFAISAVLIWGAITIVADKQCLPRPIFGKSVVCVCNTDHCDELVREQPKPNSFVSYTTSEGGQRFEKSGFILQETAKLSHSMTKLNVDTTKTYQTIAGFGGSITDAAAINWLSLKDRKLQKYLMDSYFSKTGLEYNMIRTPIGGSDFSTHRYALNEHPIHDAQLKNFSLAAEDHLYKIPMFKAALRSCEDDQTINVIATTWSPPDWMKVGNNISVCGVLNPKYYQTYADYHIKFIEEYKKQGIDVWAITTTNEPINAFYGKMIFNCLGWSAFYMAEWIQKFLGPSFRKSKFKDTKIFALDDQRFNIPLMWNELAATHPRVMDFIDGAALHAYADRVIDASMIQAISKPYPDKTILVTEFCEGYIPTELNKVDLGSWFRATSYITSIIENLNHNAAGYIDWNLCLNENGGPNWALNFVDSPIIVYPEKNEFVKQPTFYAMGHFSKFIPRGSKRVKVIEDKTAQDSLLQSVAFLTPRNTTVVVLYNPSIIADSTISVKVGGKAAIVKSPMQSVVTVEIALSSDEKVEKKEKPQKVEVNSVAVARAAATSAGARKN